MDVAQTKGATFQINNVKLYVPVVSLFINDINFLENIRQGLKRTNYWNKYRSESATQPRKNISDYMVNLTFKNIIDCFFIQHW